MGWTRVEFAKNGYFRLIGIEADEVARDGVVIAVIMLDHGHGRTRACVSFYSSVTSQTSLSQTYIVFILHTLYFVG